MPVASLLLIRHGQSTWNQAGIWQGWSDPPLSEQGIAQARAAGRELASGDCLFSAVASSDLRRATQTAEVIASCLGLSPGPIDPALRERDMGEWSGLDTEAINERWPGQIEAYKSGRLSGPPGGEGQAQLLQRARQAVLRLAASGQSSDAGINPSVIAVTHGGLIRAIEHSLDHESAVTANLAGRWLTVQDGGELHLGPAWAGPSAKIAGHPRNSVSEVSGTTPGS